MGRINGDKRSAALNTALPERCRPTLKVYSPFPLWCVSHVEKWFWQGEHPERKARKWSAPRRSLKAGFNQCLKPGLKFPCPVHRALDGVRRPELRQIPKGSQASPQGQMRSPQPPACFSIQGRAPNQLLSTSRVSVVIFKLLWFGALLSTIQTLWNAAMVRNNSRRRLVSGKHQMNELAY